MIDRSIKSKYINVDDHRRIIAISDIHANLPVLKKLLKKIAFDMHQDELFLVGDLLEKGAYNMETLHFIMELSKSPHVHPMMGNCDFVCKNVLYEYRLDFLKEVLLHRQNSILHEMAATLGIHFHKDIDMIEYARILKQHFPKELAFVDQLPHVVETQHYIFGHAAILDEDHYGKEMRDIMTHNRFLDDAKRFQKYVVVGHLPVSEYCDGICCFNPMIDDFRHIIAIDGGNEVKSAGQLNALLIEHGNFSYAHSDCLKKAKVLDSIQPINRDPFFIKWYDSSVKILKEDDIRYLCRHLSSGKDFWIPKDFIFHKGDEIHVDNFTTYHLPVEKGDYVKIVSTCGEHALVKKNGIMGWIPRKILSK